MSATAYSAASVYIPRDAGVKAGTLQAWRPDVKLLQDIDVSRPATTNVASYVNSAGVLVFVGANVPRWDWSEGGSCPSLLVEPQRTNLFDQDLDTGAPATQTITVVNGTEYTVSMRGSGTVTLTNAGTGVVSEGTHVTFTAGSTSLVCTVSASGVDYVNVEAGGYPTSIIYTSGGTATRNRDVISKSGIASLINSSEGTLYVELSVFSIDDMRILLKDENVNTNTIRLRLVNNNIDVTKNSTIPALSLGAYTINTFVKIAVRYSALGTAISTDGNAVIEASGDASYPTNILDMFQIGGNFSLRPFDGRIRALAWFKTALTNTELTAITTP